jgi:hypothetical protein
MAFLDELRGSGAGSAAAQPMKAKPMGAIPPVADAPSLFGRMDDKAAAPAPAPAAPPAVNTGIVPPVVAQPQPMPQQPGFFQHSGFPQPGNPMGGPMTQHMDHFAQLQQLMQHPQVQQLIQQRLAGADPATQLRMRAIFGGMPVQAAAPVDPSLIANTLG